MSANRGRKKKQNDAGQYQADKLASRTLAMDSRTSWTDRINGSRCTPAGSLTESRNLSGHCIGYLPVFERLASDMSSTAACRSM